MNNILQEFLCRNGHIFNGRPAFKTLKPKHFTRIFSCVFLFVPRVLSVLCEWFNFLLSRGLLKACDSAKRTWKVQFNCLLESSMSLRVAAPSSGEFVNWGTYLYIPRNIIFHYPTLLLFFLVFFKVFSSQCSLMIKNCALLRSY